MKSAFLAGVIASLVVVLVASPSAHAQGVGSSGTINGTVIDPTGASVPKALVVATETVRGVLHSTETDANGFYRLTGLPPTTYDVAARASGFETIVQKGLVVTVGSITQVDFHLSLATSKATIEVTAVPPIVETERGSEANTITQNYIEDLPTNRRDYLNFTLLLPGVSDSTRIADDQDFRVKQTPQSGLSFYGSNGRGNNVTVDGGETGSDSGGVRLTVSQDAVQEFQVNRSNYPADLGGASGAAINIVTKSGGNSLHGSVFGFFRNDALDARDPFAFSQALQPGDVFNPEDPDSEGSPVKNSLGRYQFGANAGFPIQKDKTFAFLAFEGLRQDAENAVPLLLDTSTLRPTAPQQQVINNLAAQGATPVTCFHWRGTRGSTMRGGSVERFDRKPADGSKCRPGRVELLHSRSVRNQRRFVWLQHAAVSIFRAARPHLQQLQFCFADVPLRIRLGGKPRRSVINRFLGRQLDSQL